MVTPFVIFPALVFGLIGGAYAGSRRIGRIAGLINVLGIFLASLAAMALLLALSEISETGAIILLKAVVLAVILGLLLGVIPLVVGYVISEYIVRRFGRQRDPPTGDEHGA
jgi:putative exporter of polyketide antibiotics